MSQSEPEILDGQKLYKVQAIIYGAPGVGKTTLASTAPSPVLFLEADPDGTLSIRESGELLWEIENLSDLSEALDWMERHPKDFQTIVIDTLTHLQQIGLDEIVDPSQWEMMRRDWGMSFRQMRALFQRLRTFPHHVVYICDEQVRTIKTLKEERIVPAITPSILGYLHRLCRLMGRLYTHPTMEGGKRTLQRRLSVAQNHQEYAKDTSGVLPGTIVDPDLGAIFEAITGIPDGKVKFN